MAGSDYTVNTEDITSPADNNVARKGAAEIRALKARVIGMSGVLFTAGGTPDEITGTLPALVNGLRVMTIPPGSNTIIAPTLNGIPIVKQNPTTGILEQLAVGDYNASYAFVFQYQVVGFGGVPSWTILFVLTQDSSPIQPIAASVAANALTLTLNTTTLSFRDATLTNGVPNVRRVSSPISITVPDTATLGTVNAIAARLMLLAIDVAGVIELAVVNQAGGNSLTETGVISTAAMSVAADANNVVYSTTARANVPYRIVGFIDITEAAAGTWATAPTLVQGAGGQALGAMQTLGMGQTWQIVVRAAATDYYNTTGKPIMLSVQGASIAAGEISISIAINGDAHFIAGGYANAAAIDIVGTAVIPPGAKYNIFSLTNITLGTVRELR